MGAHIYSKKEYNCNVKQPITPPPPSKKKKTSKLNTFS